MKSTKALKNHFTNASSFLYFMIAKNESFNIHIDLIDSVGNAVILTTDPAWKISRPNKTFNQMMETTLEWASEIRVVEAKKIPNLRLAGVYAKVVSMLKGPKFNTRVALTMLSSFFRSKQVKKFAWINERGSFLYKERKKVVVEIRLQWIDWLKSRWLFGKFTFWSEEMLEEVTKTDCLFQTIMSYSHS